MADNWWQRQLAEYMGDGSSGGLATILDTYYLRRDGGNTITGDISPDGNATRDLGDATNNIAELHARKMFSNSDVTIKADTGNDIVLQPANASVSWTFDATGDVIINANASYDIADATNNIAELHARKMLSNSDATIKAAAGNDVVIQADNASANWTFDNSKALLPAANNTYDIGSASLVLAEAYSRAVKSDDALTLMAASSKSVALNADAGGKILTFNSSGVLYPAANASYDLGSASLSFSEVHANYLISNDDVSIQAASSKAAAITTNAGGNVWDFSSAGLTSLPGSLLSSLQEFTFTKSATTGNATICGGTNITGGAYMYLNGSTRATLPGHAAIVTYYSGAIQANTEWWNDGRTLFKDGANTQWGISTAGVFFTGNNYDIGLNNATNAINNLYYTGSLTKVSDVRLKRDIVELDDELMLDKFSSLKPIRFRYKENIGTNSEIQHVGFRAQDVAIEFPELVNEAIGGPEDKHFQPMSIKIDKFIPFLVLAVKRLRRELVTTKQQAIDKIQDLTTRIEALEGN